MAQQPQGVLYYLPHSNVFKIKLADRTVDIPYLRGEEVATDSIAYALERAVVEGHQLPEPVPVDFVLPHSMYGVDYITLPAIKRKQLDGALEAKLLSMHKNYRDLVFLKQPINSGKLVTYRILFARRQLLDQLREGFAHLNVTINRFIPQGVALHENMVKLDPTLKKSGPTVLLAIGEEESYLAAYAGEILLGGLPVPFGVDALQDSRVVYEKLLYYREAAELLVINAKERAKATKLTMAIDLEEEIDDTVPNEDEVIEKNPDLPDLTVAGTDAAESAPVEEEAEEEEIVVPTVKTLKKSAVRVLPKFMRREEPTTPDGFVKENFRLFERRILMLIRDMALSDFYPKMENVYIAMPSEFEYLIEHLRAENPDLKWKGILSTEEAWMSNQFLHIAVEKTSVF